MIIQFKAANYRSIGAEQTLSFVAEKARRHPDNLISCKGYKLLKSTALFGANASGKSNLVKAIQVMRSFIRDSATRMNDGDTIEAAQPFRLDPAFRNKPSQFEITFVTEGIVYVYGFAVTQERVTSEWLSATREGTVAVVFQFKRIFNEALEKDEWEFDGFKEDDADQIQRRTLENMLALSVGSKEKVEVLRLIYRYLREHIWTLDMSSVMDILGMQTTELCQESEEVRRTLSSLLYSADTGVEDIHIKTGLRDTFDKESDVLDRLGDMPDLQDFYRAAKKLVASTPMPRITARRRDSQGNVIDFDLKDDESQGTQRFFAVAGPLLDALAKGVFVVLDEFGASMHPLLTRRLLEIFQSPEANQSGAQLLFTTHDPSLLDQELFRRDQIWLAEKCDGASTFFSLADIQPPIRNTESFLRNYLTGRYGGTPHLGRAFDDLIAGTKA